MIAGEGAPPLIALTKRETVCESFRGLADRSTGNDTHNARGSGTEAGAGPQARFGANRSPHAGAAGPDGLKAGNPATGTAKRRLASTGQVWYPRQPKISLAVVSASRTKKNRRPANPLKRHTRS